MYEVGGENLARPVKKSRTPWQTKGLNWLGDHIPAFLEKPMGWKRADDIISKSTLTESLEFGKKYLDIGSGPGHIAQRLRKVDFNIIGSDYLIKPFRSVREAQQDNQATPGLLTTAEYLPFKTNALDGVMANFVLHHVSPEVWPMVFKEIARVVKPGGTFILIEDVPRVEGDAATSLWDSRANAEIMNLIKSLLKPRKQPKEEVDQPILDRIRNGKLTDLHLTDTQWQEIFTALGWNLTDQKEFTSHDSISGKDIFHQKYVLKMPLNNESG